MDYNYRRFPLDMESEVFDAFWTASPPVGSRAPKGSLTQLDGGVLDLKDLFKAGPVVMEFGSFS